MISCKTIDLDTLRIYGGENNICPDVNIGIITYTTQRENSKDTFTSRFLVQLMFTRPSQLKMQGVLFEDEMECLMVKQQTCIVITYIENDVSETCLYPKPSRPDNDNIVFRRTLNKINDISCLDNINKYVEPLISCKIHDLQAIFDFLITLKGKYSPCYFML